MKWLNCAKIRLMLVGVVAAIVVSRVDLANGATITVGPAAGYDFDTVQAGIDAANDADTVLVAPGEYVITEPITFRGKAITVRSEAGRDETTIRMGTPADTNRGSVVIFENSETTASVLDGFTITGGRACRIWIPEASEFGWAGGGIGFNASSGTVRNCAIVQNRAEDSGGGVAVGFGSSAILTDCIIDRNVATQKLGGGVCCVYDSSVAMTDCAITGNSAGDSGGGVGVYSSGASAILMNCIISGNSTASGIASGGGVAGWQNASTILTNCTIVENSAKRFGGGLCYGFNKLATIDHCVISGNTALEEGGGGVCCWEQDSVTVTNSIIRGNTSPDGDELYVRLAATFSINYSNVSGGQAGVSIDGGTFNWGERNIDADPYFADPSGGDFHLKSEAGRWDPDSQSWVQDDVTSPCIDAADPMSPIGLEPFPNGGFVNMGAYGCTPEASKSYFGEPACGTIVAGDINGDCKVDFQDLAILTSHWLHQQP